MGSQWFLRKVKFQKKQTGHIFMRITQKTPTDSLWEIRCFPRNGSFSNVHPDIKIWGTSYDRPHFEKAKSSIFRQATSWWFDRRSWKRWHVNCGVLARSRTWKPHGALDALLNINLTRGCKQWLLCFMFLLVMCEGDTHKIQDGSLLVANGAHWPYKWALWPYL